MTELEQIGFDFLYPSKDDMRVLRPLFQVGQLVRWVRFCVDEYSKGTVVQLTSELQLWLSNMRAILLLPEIEAVPIPAWGPSGASAGHLGSRTVNPDLTSIPLASQADFDWAVVRRFQAEERLRTQRKQHAQRLAAMQAKVDDAEKAMEFMRGKIRDLEERLREAEEVPPCT